MILIDNYDSFTYNIVQYLKELGVEPKVFKNDKITVEELSQIDFSHIIISPGPGNPDDSGVTMDVLKHFYETKIILGICLGHQCIAQFFGGNVTNANYPCHGKVSKVFFEDNELFEALPQGFDATRYHSLVVENESLPENLVPIAFCREEVDGSKVLMAIKHKFFPIYGVQFHPEAILTYGGKKLLANFLSLR